MLSQEDPTHRGRIRAQQYTIPQYQLEVYSQKLSEISGVGGPLQMIYLAEQVVIHAECKGSSGITWSFQCRGVNTSFAL